MNDQQINQLRTIIESENYENVRNFILETLQEEQARQNFILGAQGVELFREANEEDKVTSAQAIFDLIPNVDLQCQFLEQVGTEHDVNSGERDNAHAIFSLALTYGGVELVRHEVDNPRYELLDLILEEEGTNGFIDAVNFDKTEVVDIILRSLESQDDRVGLINTAFEEISDNFGEDQSAANMIETMLDVLDLEHQRSFILSQSGERAFERMVINDQTNTVSLMLDSLENNEQRQDLVSSVNRNIEHESVEMRQILDDFGQQVNSDEYESQASFSDNQSDTELESNSGSSIEDNLPNILENDDSNLFLLPEISSADEQEENKSEDQEVNNKRSPSRSPSPTGFDNLSKKSRRNEDDHEL